MPPSLEDLGVERSAFQAVGHDRWQTPFTWSYPQSHFPKSRSSFVYAKPPHYHLSLFHISSAHDGSISSEPPLETGADDLNPDLVGVKAAQDAIQKYEIDVGFYYVDLVPQEETSPGISPQSYLCDEVDRDEVVFNRERWHDLVRGLTLGIVGDDSSPTSSAGLHRSTSTLSSIDLSDSERSAISNSMPSTPKPKSSYANITVNPTSPESDHHRRMSRLNASASSFIPTSVTPEKPHTHALCSPSPSTASTSSPPPTFADFSFPSLNCKASSTQSRSLPSAAPEKDEHRLYKEVVSSLRGNASTSQRPFFGRLPPFLTNPLHRRKLFSKTRTIVDGLRLSGVPETKCKSASPSPSQSPSDSMFDLDFFKPRLSVSEDGGDSLSGLTSDAEEGDGWARPEANEVDSETKSQRTRDLCLALGRNRAGSRAGKEKEGNDDDIDLGYQFLNEQSAIYSQASSSPPRVVPDVTSNDGWIGGPSSSVSRPRKLRSGNCPNPTVPFPSLSSRPTVTLPKRPRFTTTPFIPAPVSIQPPPFFPVPTMYPTYAHPYPTTAGYVQMQMHIQSQLHLQMQMQTQAHHPWFQPVAYPGPLVVPVPTQTTAPRFTKSRGNAILPDRAVLTGVSGMRHVG